MGEEIQKDHFDAADYERFRERVSAETDLLRELFETRAFDNKSRRLGYELELCLADRDGNPSRNNTDIIDAAGNPLFTTELARFNMEINGNPFSLDAAVLGKVEADLEDLYGQAERAASRFDTRIGLFGVFPSVGLEHLNPENYMTELRRYNQLNRQLLSMREEPIRLHLDGEEQLVVEKQDVMLEALATSLQIHLQVPFDDIVPTYHAALWSSMLLLPATANAPLVLGKCCWQESRIGIFKQAVDTRNPREIRDHIIPRVHFGKRYIDSLYDLFVDNRDYYSPILPQVVDGPLEDLHHLALHNGTIWRWVRPIAARNQDGSHHLRLELRVVPSGPTRVDTLANLALYLGLTEGLKTLGAQLTSVPFETLEADFYRGAREGLGAELHWPDGRTGSARKLLLEAAIPLARQTFAELGIADADRWLDLIAARIDADATGARWITNHWKRYGNASQLVCDYIDRAETNQPVHLWSAPGQ